MRLPPWVGKITDAQLIRVFLLLLAGLAVLDGAWALAGVLLAVALVSQGVAWCGWGPR